MMKQNRAKFYKKNIISNTWSEYLGDLTFTKHIGLNTYYLLYLFVRYV